MKMIVFWDITPCSLDEVDGRFRVAYCLYHQGDISWRPFETSVYFNEATRFFFPEGYHLHYAEKYISSPVLPRAVEVLGRPYHAMQLTTRAIF
jgi:hypothetical protein